MPHNSPKSRYPASFLALLRQQIALSQLLEHHVRFDRKRSNAAKRKFWACCPFHSEKTPSFLCDDNSGRYYCFGCQAMGDHFAFLQNYKGLTFAEAVKELAAYAGVQIPRADPKILAQEQQQRSLFEIMELAKDFYVSNLYSEEGYHARQYLLRRGLKSELWQQFALGLAFDKRYDLRDYLAQKSISLEDMQACGLVIKDEDKGYCYDRFRGRLIFPIFNLQNKVIAFGGRALQSDNIAKYLNSPNSDLFHKGSVLYNLNNALKALQQVKDSPLIVAEGYMDVCSLVQHGFASSVAPLGTAIGEDQLLLLWRYNNEPLLCFDGDSAGQRAALRALDRALPLLRSDRLLRFMLLPEGYDPDSLLQEKGAGAFNKYLAQPLSVLDLLWHEACQDKDFSAPEMRAKLEVALRDKLAQINDKTLAYHYRREIWQRIRDFFYRPNFSKKSHSARGKNFYKNKDFAKNLHLLEDLAPKKTPQDLIPLREATILSLLMFYPKLWQSSAQELEQLELVHKQAKILYDTMLAIVLEQAPDSRKEMREALIERGFGELVSSLEQRMQHIYLKNYDSEEAFNLAQENLRQSLALYFSESRVLKDSLKEIADYFLYSKEEGRYSEEEERSYRQELKRLLDHRNALAPIMPDQDG